MLISHSHKFIFFHVAKTGGTSTRTMLGKYAEEPEKLKMIRPPQLKAGKPNRLYEVWESLLQHAKARDVKQELPKDMFDSYYKFAFVRNPWDWHVSMYHFLLKISDPVTAGRAKSLSSFDAYIEWTIETAKPYPKGTPKFQKEAITAKDGELLVDFVGRFETLNEDFSDICKKIGVTASLPHKNQSNHRDYRSYYNAQTRNLVGEYFREDIELFGYSFDSPVCNTELVGGPS